MARIHRVTAVVALVVALTACRADDRARILAALDPEAPVVRDGQQAGGASSNDADTPQLAFERARALSETYASDVLREGHVGTVPHVVDGDTIDIEVDGRTFKVRFKGASAPECHKDAVYRGRVPRQRCVADDEFYGLESYNELVRILGEQPVWVQCDAQPGEACETDPYGRSLANVVLPDGTDVGEELLRRGAGFTSTSFASSTRARFCAAEYEARREGRGMWEGRTLGEVLALMNDSTKRWYKAHDARCDLALQEL